MSRDIQDRTRHRGHDPALGQPRAGQFKLPVDHIGLGHVVGQRTVLDFTTARDQVVGDLELLEFELSLGRLGFGLEKGQVKVELDLSLRRLAERLVDVGRGLKPRLARSTNRS